MNEIIIGIAAFLIYIKLFLFWLWLWQLKEYHMGRFLAHFKEGQALKKILSSFWRLKYPKFTKKITIIFLAGIFLALCLIFKGYYFSIFSLIIVTPLLFQIPTVIWRKRYLQKARRKRAKFLNLKVVGITGSYGKTSTKEFLAHILGQKFHVLKTPEHQNSEVGISNTILRSLTDEHDIFVCEMGAYNKGGIKLLADIVKPQIGIVTGVNEQHLATFGSMENLLSAEGGEELVKALPKDGVAIVNGGSLKLKEHISALKKANGNVKFIVGTEDIQAENIKVEKENISFEVAGTKFRISVCGGHNAQNLLLAIAAAREMGMGLEEIARACETITPDLGALKIKKGINGATIIDSTYSANPDGVIADLEYLSLYEGKKILIMPCLIELGKASKDAHKRIGEKIEEVCDLAIITTKEHFEDLKHGANQSDKVVYMENTQEILEKIKSSVKGDDAILLESRLPESFIHSLIGS